MLKLSLNMSVMLEHIHVVKTRAVRELTVIILKYFHSASRWYGTQGCEDVRCLGICLWMLQNHCDKWKCHFLDYFQKQAFCKIPFWNPIMKPTILEGHKIMLLNQVIPYLSFAIQYSSIKVIDLILPMRLFSFHWVNQRVSRVFDLYKWYSKYFSSPHRLICWWSYNTFWNSITRWSSQ